MRATAFVYLTMLVLVLAGCGPGFADTPDLPIHVESCWSAKVTESQRGWIRAWLHENLHPTDLVGIDVSIYNRCHPGVDCRALACLAPHDSGTYRIQRVVTFAHRLWPSDMEGTWAADEEWRVDDGYRVERLFRFGETEAALEFDPALSYDTVHSLLRSVHEGTIALPEDEDPERAPKLADISWIQGEEGRIHLTTGDFSGHEYVCERREGSWAVLEIWDWIS